MRRWPTFGLATYNGAKETVGGWAERLNIGATEKLSEWRALSKSNRNYFIDEKDKTINNVAAYHIVLHYISILSVKWDTTYSKAVQCCSYGAGSRTSDTELAFLPLGQGDGMGR